MGTGDILLVGGAGNPAMAQHPFQDFMCVKCTQVNKIKVVYKKVAGKRKR